MVRTAKREKCAICNRRSSVTWEVHKARFGDFVELPLCIKCSDAAVDALQSGRCPMGGVAIVIPEHAGRDRLSFVSGDPTGKATGPFKCYVGFDISRI